MVTKGKAHLTARDREIIRYRVVNGTGRKEIAKQVGVVPLTITRTMKKEGAAEYAAGFEAQREEKYMKVYNKAFEVAMENVVACMTELTTIALHGESERVRRDACRDIAYIAGLKPREADNAGKSQKLVIEEKPKKETKSANG